MSLDISYYSFSSSRADKGWINFREDIVAVRERTLNKNNNKLNETQERLLGGFYTSFPYELEMDKTSLYRDLRIMDLFYGAINNSEEFPESPANYEPVVQEYKLTSLEPGVVAPKESWIKLYSEMNKENIIAHAKNIAFSLNWSEDEAINLIQEFFLAMKPIVKDLRDTPDSILVIVTGGYDEFDPKEANDFLMKRAEEHATKYKDVLPILKG